MFTLTNINIERKMDDNVVITYTMMYVYSHLFSFKYGKEYTI